MAEEQTAPTCGECRYWKDEFGGGRRGACHRFPPTPVVGAGGVGYVWAATFASDVCGEHKPHEVAEEAVPAEEPTAEASGG